MAQFLVVQGEKSNKSHNLGFVKIARISNRIASIWMNTLLIFAKV